MITKDLVQNRLRPRINALLEPLAKELGLTLIRLSTATYSDTEVTFKLVCSKRRSGAGR